METSQNVSAQVYFKQLPNDPNAGNFGCNNKGDGILSTCVNDVDTDKNIENAFQDQLDLSEYYKSPEVFDQMKKRYMDPTMENLNADQPQEVPKTVVPMVPVPQKTPVGPTDFLDKKISKSTFGGSKSNFGPFNNQMLLILLVLGILFFYFFVLKK